MHSVSAGLQELDLDPVAGPCRRQLGEGRPRVGDGAPARRGRQRQGAPTCVRARDGESAEQDAGNSRARMAFMSASAVRNVTRLIGLSWVAAASPGPGPDPGD